MRNFIFFKLTILFTALIQFIPKFPKKTKKYTYGASHDILVFLVIFFGILLTFMFIIIDKISLT